MNRKIIIFSQFSKMCQVIERELAQYKPLMIIGETPEYRRKEIVDLFNEQNDHHILILSSAGQFGLNLQAASVVINYDLPWSLGKLEQRIGRAHRMGQKETVLVYNLLVSRSMDTYAKKTLAGKRDISDKLLLRDARAVLQE